VMVKPGAYAPASSHTLSRLIQKYLDPECIKVAEGDRAVTGALLEQRYDKICFTGSGFVGKIVLESAAKHLTPCILELGGKSPCIVDASANLEHAADRLVWGTFLNGGQSCVRPDFVLVHEQVAERFLAQLGRAIEQFYGVDPSASEWFGRAINDKAYERLATIVKGAAADKKVLIGGKCEKTDRYIAPTVLDYGSDLTAFAACEAMQDELFGPVLPVARYTDLEQVFDFCKNLVTGKPLALYCFSTDGTVIEGVKRRTTSGGLCINDTMMHLTNHEIPFGGVGASGMGSYHGHRSFLAFTHEKAVLEKSPLLDQSPLFKPLLAARFPPYSPFKQTLIKVFSARAAEVVLNSPRRPSFWLVLCAIVGWMMGLRVTWVG